VREIGDPRQPYSAGVQRVQRSDLGIGRRTAHLPDNERLAVHRDQIGKSTSNLNTNMHFNFLRM
jgi:hypothetical protein